MRPTVGTSLKKPSIFKAELSQNFCCRLQIYYLLYLVYWNFHHQIYNLIDVLVDSGLATSKREARTFIESGGVQVNNEKIESVEKTLSKDEYGEKLLLQRGKKNHILVELN